MALTPADVHNVAFSRPRIGKRGYNEQEVDLFIDLVEQELTRHITEDARLRKRNGTLQRRGGGARPQAGRAYTARGTAREKREREGGAGGRAGAAREEGGGRPPPKKAQARRAVPA